MIRILLILFCLFLPACKNNGGKDLVESVKNQFTSATEQIGPVANEVATQTSEQAAKVLRYEYKVETVSKDSNDQTIEATLNKFGEDRWECFSIIPTDLGTRITCRRVPYAALRYFLKLM